MEKKYRTLKSDEIVQKGDVATDITRVRIPIKNSALWGLTAAQARARLMYDDGDLCIIERPTKKQKWFTPTEKLPDNRRDVFVETKSGEYYKAWFSPDGLWSSFDYHFENQGDIVVRWRELPRHKKQKEKYK
jgi:hypothetical protein